ncbi:hypothetical protein [Aquabacterium sp.]|uniref:hypothetical protein n=1 Tax=Aquabacterium sp. TaxID=1872578 RepID=UPI004037EA83
MAVTISDIATYAWLDPDSVGSPTSREHSLALLRDSVIHPSLRALDAEIDALRKSDEPAADFYAEDLADLFQTTVEGYLLTVQSMWERGLRGMLILRENALSKGANLTTVERASWVGQSPNLHDHFERLMGVSLQSFDSYADLDLLQSFGNAIRHGDGSAARRVHQLCPSLWWNWMAPGETLVAGPFRITMPEDSPKHPSFASITLPESVLDQMIESVLWFWEDIENMRCNSFRQKHVSVVQSLASWEEKRQRRQGNRMWSPG